MSFTLGELRTAIAGITVMPGGLGCVAELYLVQNNIKIATSGKFPFTSTGTVQNVTFPVTMPGVGTYVVYLDISAGNQLIAGYVATEQVVIVATSGITIGWKDWGKGQPYPPWVIGYGEDELGGRFMGAYRTSAQDNVTAGAADAATLIKFGLDPLTVRAGDVSRDILSENVGFHFIQGRRLRITGIYSYDAWGKVNYWTASYESFHKGIVDDEDSYNLFLKYTVLDTPREYDSIGLYNGDHNAMLKQLEEIGAADVTDVWRAQVGSGDWWLIRMIVKDAHKLYVGLANGPWSMMVSYDAKM